jgi:predicted dinucleotide-binding enzyme
MAARRLAATIGAAQPGEEDRVRVLVVGSGTLATSLAHRLRKAGHDGDSAPVPDDAMQLKTRAQRAAVVFLVVPFDECLDLPHTVFAACVVADATDYFRPSGTATALGKGISPSELLADHLHGAALVRIIGADTLLAISEQGPFGGAVPRVAVPIAGDDMAAKAAVASLISDLGFDPVDVGTLRDARETPPGSPLRAPVLDPEDPRTRIADV